MNSIRLMIYWLLWKVLRWPSVVLVDFDGEINARLVKGTKSHPIATRMGFGMATVRLLDDGATVGRDYVKRWEPLFPPLISSRDRA